jgi:ankyrin repeat protein
MRADQSIPLLYSGQAGDYFGSDYEGLPGELPDELQAIDRQLQGRGLQYFGKLTCSQFQFVHLYSYGTADQRVAVSVMVGEDGIQGIDCVSKFADDSFLTTTTVKVLQDAYDEQRLFRVSFPGLSALELLDQHLLAIVSFESRCGEAIEGFDHLLAIAQLVDEYTQRQESNSGHGILQFLGGFAQGSLAQLMDSPAEDDSDEDDNDDYCKDGESNKLNEKLGDAALYGKTNQVQRFLTAGADPNAITESGKTPLMYAAMYGHKGAIEALLNAGADPNVAGDEDGEEGQTALMCIASSFFASNRAEVIRLLVDRGANPDQQDDQGQTALMIAGENADSVKALLDAGANPDLRDSEGNSAMMLGNWAIQQLLRQAGASEAGLNDVALSEAARDGNLPQVEALLSGGANVNYGDGSALTQAASYGHLAIVDRLIQAGADVNLGWKTGKTAIATAAYAGHLALVQRLLAAGANPALRCHDEEFYDALGHAELGQAEGNHPEGDYPAVIALLKTARS